MQKQGLRRALGTLLLALLATEAAAEVAGDAVPVQQLRGRAPDGGGRGRMPDSAEDRIGAEQREAIWSRLRERLARLPPLPPQAQKKSQPKLGWPLLASPQLSDPGYHGVSNFVDHDAATSVIDYSCAARSYDGHAGTDIFTWPFSWLKTSRGDVQIVAAAAGRIIDKLDGNPDQSCAADGGDWNAVYLQQNDGSIVWYGHMKQGSLTSKAVGDSVAAGEFLGLVGSSGNSTGPHLHLELYDAAGTLTDPYVGSCNALTTPWWKSQPAYRDSAINLVTVGYDAPLFPACPGIESPNTRDSFNPGERVYLTNYYRDQVAGQVSDFQITQPDGVVYSSWSQTSPDTYNASYWYWYFTLPSAPQTGTWKFTVSYQGVTLARYFNVGSPTSVKVKVPNGGEIYNRGDKIAVKWKSNIGGELRAELWMKSVFIGTLFKTTPNDGKQNWTIPTDLAPGSKYRIKLVDLADETVQDLSDGNFTVQ
ncbi:MAG: hypothetical protein JWQ90_2084 [Hydrocarboniphaga sp.]|uniref:M23 family metallopeptidase n=1 Tax=Hydrocarboniphaga sp. TaxID=2033016 RepID=UPI002630B6A1|nr:peptidoglycan DD-metalloendopeptidase family protein [Hydrocarboniphaga sp.]MDB5969634.1 hypothetical protein [Hydrocarboniphaga sp.]